MFRQQDFSNWVCFTGHRPEKIIRSEQEIKKDLEAEILRAYSEGFTGFISGMARGTDIWAAESVLRLRSQGFPLRLLCACPYPGFEKSWSSHWQQRYRNILSSADQFYFICPSYCRSCFQRRNEWMADHSSRVIAVYSGEKGGTRNTIAYALRKNLPVVYIPA